MLQRDLFISHSSADAGTANDLVTDFERHGISCWIAPRDVPLGSAYHREIVNAIAQCRAMLLLFSVTANESDHVLREVELAAQGRKPIYPLRLDGVEPAGGLKYMLANMQWVERRALGDRLTATIEQLLRASGSAEVAPGPSPQPAPTERGPRIPSAIWAAAVGAAVVLLGAAWYLMRPPEPAPHPSATVTPPREVTPASQPSATAAKLTQTNPDKITVASAAPSKLTSGGSQFFRECNECPVMAVVPAGRTLIGSPTDEPGHTSEEGPQREVAFTRPFAIGRSEVTFEQWFACVAEGAAAPIGPAITAGARGAVRSSTSRGSMLPPMWIGYHARPGHPTDCLPKPNGSMRRAAASRHVRPPHFGSATRSLPSKQTMIGVILMRAAPRCRRYVRLLRPIAARRIRSACCTRRITSGNGYRIAGILPWRVCLRMARHVQRAIAAGESLRGGSGFDEPQDLRTAKRNWAPQEERRAQIGFRVTRSLGPRP